MSTRATSAIPIQRNSILVQVEVITMHALATACLYLVPSVVQVVQSRGKTKAPLHVFSESDQQKSTCYNYSPRLPTTHKLLMVSPHDSNTHAYTCGGVYVNEINVSSVYSQQTDYMCMHV